MPILFFDTSALVKRYHVERGSQNVNGLFKNAEDTFLIANITLSEITSAFVRKFNAGEITEEKLKHFLSEIAQDIVYEVAMLEIEQSHIRLSQSLIIKHNLRALDGIQLAVVLSLKSMNPLFVCSDKHLLGAAKTEGINVLNPET